jgi:hypothetical protein
VRDVVNHKARDALDRDGRRRHAARRSGGSDPRSVKSTTEFGFDGLNYLPRNGRCHGVKMCAPALKTFAHLPRRFGPASACGNREAAAAQLAFSSASSLGTRETRSLGLLPPVRPRVRADDSAAGAQHCAGRMSESERDPATAALMADLPLNVSAAEWSR